MAQLVARLVRNEKVGGSNPPSSTTGRHPIRMSVFCMPGRFVAAGVPGAGGPGCGAGLLCVPVGGGPPASRPRGELRSARRLEARPGPAAAHGHRSLTLQALRRPPHRRRLVAVSSLARPRRRPRAPQPGYRTKRVGFVVTVRLAGAEKSVLKLVGANLKDG